MEEFLKKYGLDFKHLILIITTISGYIFAYFQIRIKRRYEINDKIAEKKFEVYSSVLKKIDEINQNIRLDPSDLFNISAETFSSLLNTKNEDEINDILIRLNNRLVTYSKKSLAPFQILNNEMNSLFLISSEELSDKLKQYKEFSENFFKIYNQILECIATSNSENLQNEIESLKNDVRIKNANELYKDIIEIMRKEIGYFRK
ncbi:MAG: hypothetical protein JXI43_14605 [Tissierellales bacterium]|nr:hypothetical protein [Tissierellales bacterium]